MDTKNNDVRIVRQLKEEKKMINWSTVSIKRVIIRFDSCHGFLTVNKFPSVLVSDNG
jgi:hypothetical protein